MGESTLDLPFIMHAHGEAEEEEEIPPSNHLHLENGKMQYRTLRFEKIN